MEIGKREVKKCLSSSTEGRQFFLFEFKLALKGLKPLYMIITKFEYSIAAFIQDFFALNYIL